MDKNKLTLNDRKTLQLEMLKEVDAFCRANNIKYALSCGTLIGAVRHHGFIPWDDDVDITMHYADILRFRELFNSENIKYCDLDTEKNYSSVFSRLASKKTYNKIGCHKSYGVCIDLYPIVECVTDKQMIECLIDKGNRLLKKRLAYMKWNSRILRYTPFSTIPRFKKVMRDYYDFMIDEVQTVGGGNYYQIGGPIAGAECNFFHNMWSFDPLEKLDEVEFENLRLLIPSRYDEFLKTRYGNYMQLPPEKDRHTNHGNDYYWE